MLFAVRGGQDSAGDAVGTVEVFCHLGLEILEAVEPQGLMLLRFLYQSPALMMQNCLSLRRLEKNS